MNEVSSTAWHLGVEKFISTLPPEHKKLFTAPANAEDCLLLIQRAQIRNRKFDRLAEILRPLVEPLRRFEASIDVLVQTYSSVASPVWGPLRVVITLISDRLSTLSNVATLLERLVEPLQRFNNYEAMFRDNSHLRSAVGALYCDLIEFCTRVVSHCSKNVIRKSFGSFDKDVSEISEKIRHHWGEVDMAANAANLEEAKMARQTADLSKALELRKDINRWLAPSNVQDDLHRLQLSCMKGSCDWIVQTDEFQALVHASNSYILRLSGHPGGGKSTAASFLTNHLLSSTKDPVLYFFCKATDSEKSFTINIIRTLMWQLLQFDESLYLLLFPAYHRSGRKTIDSEFEAFALIDILLAGTTHSPIYFVLDAIDECHDAPTLLQLLKSGRENLQRGLKFVISGRTDPSLTILLKQCDRELALHSHTAPLNEYIKDRVSNLDLPIDQNSQIEIIRKVTNSSNGLWLFARLLIDQLSQAPTHDEIQRQLTNIPDGLAQLYTSIITTKEARLTKLQLKMAQQLYLWIDTSEYVPEWFWKDTNGDSLEDDMVASVLKFAMRSNSDIFAPIKLVQDLCAPLVHTRLLHQDFIIHHSAVGDSSTFVAEFFHQTAKQYLSYFTDSPLSQIPLSLRPRRLGALHRGACAAWYFSESADFHSALQRLRERPRNSSHIECYFEMSSGLWQCLKLNTLRRDVEPAELREAEDLCAQLHIFLASDQCLAFLEATIILHFSQRSTVLLYNIDESYDASSTPSAPDPPEIRPPFLERLLELRRRFMRDLAWIIISRWPSNDIDGIGHLADKFAAPPDGFEQRPLARKIQLLALRYQWLLLSPGARSINCFMLNGKG